jgi:hypothetical protein
MDKGTPNKGTRKRRAVVSSKSAEEEPDADVPSSPLARRPPLPKKKKIVVKLDENGRALLRFGQGGAISTKCTFCNAAEGYCTKYYISIGTDVWGPNCPIAVFNLGTGAEHRPTCHRAFGDTMKAFRAKWVGVHNMEQWLEHFYESDSE